MVHGKMNAMKSATVSIDQAGRIVLPKPLRDRFHLMAGDRFQIAVENDTIRLTPVRNAPTLVKKDGWWVHQGVPSAPLAPAVEWLREERTQKLIRIGRDE
jgi:AbrB family looped-hinge helix DNA binding protein